jgi:hypothetical protein
MYCFFFLIELHTINESTSFLRNLIHDIGVRLKTYAICVQIRRIKDGFCEVNNSLGYNEWSFENIEKNLNDITQLSKHYIDKLDKTILVGSKKSDQKF